MNFQLDKAVEILAETPRVLRALLEGKSSEWVLSNYGPNTFGPFDVIGHLIHGEKTDWIPRARMILEHGEGRTFEPFDRYAMFEESKGKTIIDLLLEFEELRTDNIRLLKAMNLCTSQFLLTGKHPALGRVSLGQLLATWVVHDLNHVAQIAKAMSFQYADEVGPWREYLSILRPPAA
jgi:hypothetical protein